MNTRHVPSLELCQELDRLCKEKGIVVPETEYVWVPEMTVDGKSTNYRLEVNDGGWDEHCLKAPLVSEQGEWLPEIVDDDGMDARVVCYKNDSKWTVMYGLYGMEIEVHSLSADTEANARQKMINYLIAEEIIITL